MDLKSLQALIEDAERRLGSYIAQGGRVEDQYVQDQNARIRKWEAEAAELCKNKEGK